MKKLNEKIIDFYINEGLDDSKFLFELYYQELNYHKKELELLERKKPFSFQKKKIKEYEESKKEILNKIEKCEEKLKEEYKLLENLMIDKKN